MKFQYGFKNKLVQTDFQLNRRSSAHRLAPPPFPPPTQTCRLGKRQKCRRRHRVRRQQQQPLCQAAGFSRCHHYRRRCGRSPSPGWHRTRPEHPRCAAARDTGMTPPPLLLLLPPPGFIFAHLAKLQQRAHLSPHSPSLRPVLHKTSSASGAGRASPDVAPLCPRPDKPLWLFTQMPQQQPPRWLLGLCLPPWRRPMQALSANAALVAAGRTSHPPIRALPAALPPHPPGFRV